MAAEQPDASLAELAAEIPSATPDLVESVLEEYGDPAKDGAAESPDAVDDLETADGIRDLSVDESDIDADAVDADPDEAEVDDAGDVGIDDAEDDEDAVDADPGSDEDAGGDEDGDHDEDEDGSSDHRSAKPSYPDVDSLTAKQRRTLEAIRASPEATQGELAAELDVTAPTISNRVNSLPGFEWSQRETFVDEVLSGSTEPTAMDTATTTPDTDAEPADELAELVERLNALEAKVAAEEAEDETAAARPAAVLADPELLHKVVHACMESSAITEAEELRILEALLPTSTAEA